MAGEEDLLGEVHHKEDNSVLRDSIMSHNRSSTTAAKKVYNEGDI